MLFTQLNFNMPFQKGHKLWDNPKAIATQFKKGDKWHLGFKHSEESNEKNRQAHLGKKMGAENPAWKGGVTPLLNKIKRLPKYKDWQKEVLKRDDFTCRKCLKRGGELTPHHLVAFSLLIKVFKIRNMQDARTCFGLWNIRNGITVCRKCHGETSNFGWRAVKSPRDRVLYPKIIAILFIVFLFSPFISQAATFGYTTAGASFAFLGHDYRGESYTASEDGTLDKLTAYLEIEANESSKLIIYENDTATTGNLIQASSEITTETAGAWLDGTMSSNSLTNGTKYAIVGYGDSTRIAYDIATGVDRTKFGSSGYPTVDDPITFTTGTNLRYSIYATYTVDAPVGVRSLPILNNGTIILNAGTFINN